MQRREFLRASSLAAAGLAVRPLFAEAASRPPGQPQPAPQPAPEAARGAQARAWPAPFDSAPVLQSPAPDGMTVVVAVNAASTAWVEYGPTEALGERADGGLHGLRPFNARVHHIRIEGLKPASKYFYRVVARPINFAGPYKISGGEAVPGPAYSFTTMDEGRGRECSFSVINDTHENVETLRGVTENLAAAKLGMVFWNGDIFNDIRSDEQIVGQVLRPAGMAYAAEQPMCFVSGNHDVRGVHARCLDWFIVTPHEQNRRYGLMRQGPVAIITLDTGEDKPDEHPVYAGLGAFARYREVQRVWLEKAVKSEAWRSAAFRVALLHIPLWGKAASEDSRAKWHPILNAPATRLDAIICGHVHEYAYTKPDKDHAYAQLVGGGPKPETATIIHARADGRRMGLIVQDIGGKEIGNFDVGRG